MNELSLMRILECHEFPALLPPYLTYQEYGTYDCIYRDFAPLVLTAAFDSVPRIVATE